MNNTVFKAGSLWKIKETAQLFTSLHVMDTTHLYKNDIITLLHDDFIFLEFLNGSNYTRYFISFYSLRHNRILYDYFVSKRNNPDLAYNLFLRSYKKL